MRVHIPLICFALGVGQGIALRAQTPVGGLIENQSWSTANSPFVVTNDVTVTSLVINAGVHVQVAPGKKFLVTGRLEAIGAPAAPIVFEPSDPAHLWDGLTFMNADTNSTFDYCEVHGAGNSGLKFRGTPLTLRHCLISGNSAMFGGGINTDSSLRLVGCEVRGNTASSTWRPYTETYGGGIYASGPGSATLALVDSVVADNLATAIQAYGGGVATEGLTLSLTRSEFTGNRAIGRGGTTDAEHNLAHGGAIHARGRIVGESSTVKGSFAKSSDCQLGAGIYGTGAISLTNCDISGNHGESGDCGTLGGGIHCLAGLELRGCRIAGNFFTAAGTGNVTLTAPAIYCSDSAGVLLQNCLVINNFAGGPRPTGAVLFENGSGDARVVNCLFYGNNVAHLVGGRGLVENSIFWGPLGSGGFSGTYSLFVGGLPADHNLDFGNLTPKDIFDDLDNFFLAKGSPVIDAGNPDPAFNDTAFPPSKGTARNDMGPYGGPGAVTNPVFIPSLQIVTQPKSQSADYGASVELSVATSGAAGPLSYQWLRDGAPLPNATNATLVISNFAKADVGAYVVVVTDQIRVVTSNPAFVNVGRLDIRMFAGAMLNGEVGQRFLIQSTPAVGGDGSWTTLTNIALPAQTYIFIDYESPFHPVRFYRAIPAP